MTWSRGTPSCLELLEVDDATVVANASENRSSRAAARVPDTRPSPRDGRSSPLDR
jgi:hypothetical protein